MDSVGARTLWLQEESTVDSRDGPDSEPKRKSRKVCWEKPKPVVKRVIGPNVLKDTPCTTTIEHFADCTSERETRRTCTRAELETAAAATIPQKDTDTDCAARSGPQMGNSFGTFLGSWEGTLEVHKLFEEDETDLSPEEREKVQRSRERHFARLAGIMIESEAFTDFKLPHKMLSAEVPDSRGPGREHLPDFVEESKGGDQSRALSTVASDEDHETKTEWKRGIPVRYFTIHEDLRWEWVNASTGEMEFANLIGGGKQQRETQNF